ncbi:M20/M25/M40 family metallo-hydrolase [Streptomyces sp. NPDC005202]|uniref:M20 family metallopeptidase n=1 Tax=Streptomyces sp. NPDC005202 TaxID=3157021 RepID=UPI0033B67E81
MRADSEQSTASVVELARELIRRPSRAGIDDYGPVLEVLEDWLAARELPHRRLHDGTARPVALLVEIAGGRAGPWWALDACVDTAPFGDEAAWSFPPASGDVVDGSLRGRGAADSKLAAALFCHLAAEVRPRAESLRGGLAVLLDADEHTGAFGGARAYLADPAAARPAGVMIGYPGPDEVVVGGRGLWRATLAVHGASGHSGSSRLTVGAVSRAAELVRLLDAAALPGADERFPLPPKLTVTFCHGGQGFSVVPDRCELGVDIRTTPAFAAAAAEALVRAAAAELDARVPAPRPTGVTPVAEWPPFRLAEDEQPAAALLDAAAREGLTVRAKTAGPSNIGNLLAAEGVPATAGFGLPYESLHGVDERVRLAELPTIHAVYCGPSSASSRRSAREFQRLTSRTCSSRSWSPEAMLRSCTENRESRVVRNRSIAQ